MATKTVSYGEEILTVDASLSVDEARDCLVELFPDIENATYTEDDAGNLTFQAAAGEKG